MTAERVWPPLREIQAMANALRLEGTQLGTAGAVMLETLYDELKERRSAHLSLVLNGDDDSIDIYGNRWRCQFCHKPTEVGRRACPSCERDITESEKEPA